MANTRFIFGPNAAEPPSSNYPKMTDINRRPVLGFDAATSQTAYFTVVAPQGISGAWSAVISYCMASATTGGVAFDVAVEAITSGDATDLDATTSFDTVNGNSDTSVPGTAGYMEQLSITLTNMDSVAAADLLRFSLARDVADANDTASGDCYVLTVEIRDGG